MLGMREAHHSNGLSSPKLIHQLLLSVCPPHHRPYTPVQDDVRCIGLVSLPAQHTHTQVASQTTHQYTSTHELFSLSLHLISPTLILPTRVSLPTMMCHFAYS